MEQPTRTRKILKGIIIERIKEGNDKLVLSYLHITTDELDIILKIIYKLMPNITRLYLRANRITSLPESIILLKHIYSLDLSFNYIMIIPSFINELEQLWYLELDYNEIEVIGYESLMNCKNLKYLSIDDNRNLTHIDMRIFDLPMLSYIYIFDTNISKEYLCELAKYLRTSITTVKICLSIGNVGIVEL